MWTTIRRVVGLLMVIILTASLVLLLTDNTTGLDDQTLLIVAGGAGVLLAVVAMLEFREAWHMSRVYSEVPEDEPESPTNRSYPLPYREEDDPYPIYESTERKLDDAEEFMGKVNDRVNGHTNGRVRISIDVEDTKDDDE